MALKKPKENDESPWDIERRQRRALDIEKRQAIIKAASIAFASRGFHDTSMEDIASTLHIFKPTLYKYFKSKKALFEACAEQAAEFWLGAAMLAHNHKGPAVERLEYYMRRNFEYISTEIGKAMQKLDVKAISDEAERTLKGARSKVDQIFREIIQDGIDAGEIDPRYNPRLVSFALFGCFNFAAEWYKPDGEFTAEEITEQFFSMFIKGLSPA